MYLVHCSSDSKRFQLQQLPAFDVPRFTLCLLDAVVGHHPYFPGAQRGDHTC